MVETTATRSFRRLYEEHHRAVLSYFLRRIDRDSAYEAAQDVYVIAWRKLDSIPDGEMELAWLYTVARGVLLSYKGAWLKTTTNGQTVSALAPTTKADLSEGACYNDTRVAVAAA